MGENDFEIFGNKNLNLLGKDYVFIFDEKNSGESQSNLRLNKIIWEVSNKKYVVSCYFTNSNRKVVMFQIQTSYFNSFNDSCEGILCIKDHPLWSFFQSWGYSDIYFDKENNKILVK